MLILDKQNGIEGWQDSLGRDILFPKQEVKGRLRGGAHACVPNFGNLPVGQKFWEGFKLPHHGLFRLPISEESLKCTTLQNGFESTQKCFYASDDYPFDFAVSEDFREYNTNDQLRLEYILRVRRDSKCTHPKPMPVSLGWHPYFATHGKDFTVLINDRPQIRETDRIEPAAVFDYFDQRVILETCHHTVKFEFFGTDIVYFWSADKSTHVCIEATAHTEKTKLLKPGASTVIGVRVHVLRCF